MSAENEMASAARPTKLETAANLTTIMVSLLLSIVLVKVYLLPESRPAASAARPQVTKGTSLKGVCGGLIGARMVARLSSPFPLVAISAQTVRPSSSASLKRSRQAQSFWRFCHKRLKKLGYTSTSKACALMTRSRHHLMR